LIAVDTVAPVGPGELVDGAIEELGEESVDPTPVPVDDDDPHAANASTATPRSAATAVPRVLTRRTVFITHLRLSRVSTRRCCRRHTAGGSGRFTVVLPYPWLPAEKLHGRVFTRNHPSQRSAPCPTSPAISAS
jgi:hypothetical protein